jgi:hypothetical protein
MGAALRRAGEIAAGPFMGVEVYLFSGADFAWKDFS